MSSTSKTIDAHHQDHEVGRIDLITRVPRNGCKRDSPGLLDNNSEQIRNKLKISAYVFETT